MRWRGGPLRGGDRPPTHYVRHVFWMYPLISVAMLGAIAVLAAAVGSPNWPKSTIARTATVDPGGTILAFTQELDGTSSSTQNQHELGMGPPAQVFVVKPLATFVPLLRPSVGSALDAYQAASATQQVTWAAAYETALATITPMPTGGGEMETAASPDDSKLDTLHGDFGPVPTLVRAELTLAQRGYLDEYLLGVEPGHSYHLVNIWLYDEPKILNDAVAGGLTDDQWGMVKERGFSVGPWYLILPAIIHVKLPNGATGDGFVLDNLLVALFFILAVPLLPGLRDLPKRLKLYRFIYRYPKRGEAVPQPSPVQRRHVA